MTQDEIIELAREAGSFIGCATFAFTPKELEAFAKLVTQHERERIKQANAPEIEKVNAHIKKLEDAVLAEREACAQVCDDMSNTEANMNNTWRNGCRDSADAIRARGQE
jgi:hypothetical protein